MPGNAAAAPGTVAILVTYRPDLSDLDALIAALVPQVAALVVVDNGSGPSHADGLRARFAPEQLPIPVRLICQPDNMGLGHGLNTGIAAARTLAAARVLLLDQDSVPAPAMVAALCAALDASRRRGDRPAAVGPVYHEPHRPGPSPFGGAAGRPGPIETAALITSGLLLPLDVFDKVGPFDETLFVDLTDTEWCFRARAAGLRCFGVPQARMTHRIGDTVLRLARRNMSVHTPLRNYYQIRNALALCRRRATPLGWKLREIPRVFARSLILIVLVRQRRVRARLIALGVVHGIRNHLGKGGQDTARNRL